MPQLLNENIFFITGIDTGIGKTYATGFIALELKIAGYKVITQKLVQTGCTGIAEDIITHRKIMGEPLNEFDINKTTCPYVFEFPASPHLASKLENKIISLDTINNSTKTLSENFDIVLIEGAGGIMVPITEDLLTLDFIKNQGYPVIIVSSPRLGSINHTLLTAEICKNAGIRIARIVYNNFTQEKSEISEDSKRFLQEYFKQHHPECLFSELGKLNF